ncbi:MAG: hypothetical protein UZ15_CFX003001035 [Chloroflexi bacterium OLB15]|nr:MAG: hypothetical protein UZ15_CFX003001035 [Chloroflexi bacterium OLB15]
MSQPPVIVAAQGGLRSLLARLFWQVHSPVTVLVGAPPAVCLQTLATATRPSTKRLHHRDLFQEGRRYYLQPLAAGFRLTSDTRVFWGERRRRTGSAAVLDGRFSAAGENDGMVTLMRLNARMTPVALATALLLPLFIASIVAYMPWDRSIIITLIVALFALGWISQRFNAAYQANEMVFFVRKVMEDLPQANVPELVAHGPDLVVNKPANNESPSADFMSEWERFYGEQVAKEREGESE